VPINIIQELTDRIHEALAMITSESWTIEREFCQMCSALCWNRWWPFWTPTV